MLDPVMKCFTRNLGVLGSSRTGSSVFSAEVSTGKTLQSPRLVLVNPRKGIYISRNLADVLLKVLQKHLVYNTYLTVRVQTQMYFDSVAQDLPANICTCRLISHQTLHCFGNETIEHI